MKFRLLLQILLPVAVLALGAFTAHAIISTRRPPVVEPHIDLGPIVRTRALTTAPMQLDVITHGVVEPLRKVELAAEVGGRIVATHDALRAGGTFTPEDVLVQIDDRDYRLAVTQQQAAVARAELRLQQEQAEAKAALRAWRELNGNAPADPLVRREPQIHEARLAVAAAEALLEGARRDLDRTRVRLPFAGRVQRVQADVGQTVQRGQPLATTFDTSAYEVRLPIPLADTAFLDLPLRAATEHGPKVELTTRIGGRACSWTARIVRVEGEVDRRTRQLTAVARVRADDDSTAPPLLVGMFVTARIRGRTVDDVIAVPPQSMHSDDHVWLVLPEPTDSEPQHARLVDRTVDVLRVEADQVLIRGGLSAGEHVCLSVLDAPVDGMTVRIATAPGEDAR